MIGKFTEWVKANNILDESKANNIDEASHSKSENDLYGEAFEKLLVNELGGKVKITPAEADLISQADVIIAADAIRKKFKKIRSVQHIGPAVKNESGDIKVNGKNVEIKYVGQGHGTYWNTSMEAFINMFPDSGIESYTRTKDFNAVRQYLDRVYKEYEMDIDVFSNTSPVPSGEKFKKFRRLFDRKAYDMDTLETLKDEFGNEYQNILFDELTELELPIRQKWVKRIIKYFENNPDEIIRLYNIVLNKAASDKQTPDYYLVYNYTKQTAEITSALELATDDIKLKTSDEDTVSFIVGNFRLTFAWQNGTGLSNPTVRAFII